METHDSTSGLGAKKNKTLTEFAINALKFEGKTRYVWDPSLPAFGVRVGKTRKTFTVIRGKTRERITIGQYPAISPPRGAEACEGTTIPKSPPTRHHGFPVRPKPVNQTARFDPQVVQGYRAYPAQAFHLA